MSESSSENTRRDLLKATAGLAIGQLALNATSGLAAAASDPTVHSPTANHPSAPPAGKPGEFDFLTGEWKIQNRRLKGPNDWDEFEGEATCWSILGGVGSIEELRIPARNFSGMGLRLLNREKKVWNDFWVNSKSGELTTPGQEGGFENGVGTFTAEDMDGTNPIQVKGTWDRITPETCRWQQSTSKDGGKTWELNWSMDWVRVKPK